MTRFNTFSSALRGLALVFVCMLGLMSFSFEAKAGIGFPTVRLIAIPSPPGQCCFEVQYQMTGGMATWTSIGCVPTPPAVITGALSYAGYVNTPPPAPVWRPNPGLYFAPTGPGVWVAIGTICVNPNGVNPVCFTFHIRGINNQERLQIVCVPCGGGPIGDNPGAIQLNNGLLAGNDSNNDVEEMNTSMTMSVSSVYPNPVTDEATMSVSFHNPSQVSIVVNDMTGNTVMTIADGESLTAGTHTFSVNTAQLNSGVYYITIRSGEYHNTLQMQVVR